MPRHRPADRFRQLLAAAARIFIVEGYGRTQMQDVADVLGVAKGTVRTPAPGELAALVAERLHRETVQLRLLRALSEPPTRSAGEELTGDHHRPLSAVGAASGEHQVGRPPRRGVARVGRGGSGRGEPGQVAGFTEYLHLRDFRLPGPAPLIARTIVETCVLWAVHLHWDPRRGPTAHRSGHDRHHPGRAAHPRPGPGEFSTHRERETMSDNGDHLRGKWNKYAPRYDRDIGFFERIQFGGGREWVCSQATGDVLDVAIGTGRNLPFYPESVQLTGIDFSPAMLDIARTRATELGREIDLREADAQTLPFPNASFDTVVCTLGLCGFPDERVAIAEMHRVLRPNGTLLLLDHVGSHHKLIHVGQSLLEKLTVRMLGDYQTRRPLPLLEQVGFVIQRSERLKAGTVERVAAIKPAAEGI